jgi:hypothetical protein
MSILVPRPKSRYPVKPTVIIDTREKPANRLFAENEAGDKEVAAYIAEKVDAGDYTVKEIPGLVVIEKKQDGKELYANCIINKDTFMRSIERMRAFRHKYIIIQQTYPEFLDAKNWAPIRPLPKRFSMMAMVESWLIALSQNENIHFVFAGKQHAPRLAKRILLKTYQRERKRLIKKEKEANDNSI